MRLIKIDVDSANGEMSLSDPAPQPPLAPEEHVEWQFVGLANDCCPAIRFEVRSGQPQDSPRGPFAFLRQTGNQVFGSGRTCTGQTDYGAFVVSPRTGKTVASLSGLSLEVEGELVRTDPMIVVEPKPGTDDGLLVTPEYFSILAGDTVVWRFQGFEEPTWYPQVRFLTGPPGGGTWPFGPFASLTTGDATVVSDGNNHVTGDYSYEVAIVDSGGTPIRVDKCDPGMGNNGDPPGGSG